MEKSEVEKRAKKTRPVWVPKKLGRKRLGAPVWTPAVRLVSATGSHSAIFHSCDDVLFAFCYRTKAECRARCQMLRWLVTAKDADKPKLAA